MQFDKLGNLFEGGLNNQLGAVFNGVYKGYGSIDDMQNITADMFKKQMRINTDGLSEFTMAQIQAKAASLGLTDSLTSQVVALANDADFSAKAATGKLTWKKAISDSKIGADDLIDSLLKLDNIDENSLNKLYTIKTLDVKDIVKKEKIQSIVNSIDGLGDSIIDLGSAGATAGKSISSVFKGMAASIAPLLPLIAGVGAGLVAMTGVYKYFNQFDSAFEKTTKSFSEYKDASTELENLKNQSTDIKSQLESIGGKYNISFDGIDDVDSMIDKVESVDTLKLTDKSDLENLRNQNVELERQIALQQKATDNAKNQNKQDALNAISKEDIAVKSTKTNKDGSINTKVERTDIISATEIEISELEKLKKKREKLLKDRKDSSKKEKNDIDENIKAIDKSILDYESGISKHIEQLEVLKESLSGTKYYDQINSMIDAFNNIDLTPAEKALKNLDSFFSSSSGRNAIKEQLQDAINSGRDLSTELSRMGLTLDDLGIDNISQLSSYLQDASKSAQDAKKSIQDYSASASDVKAAGESADKDSDWSTIQGAYKTAKELLKEGKTGTDDFQSVASFLNPKLVKEYADIGGEYISDAYQKAFEKSKKYADRWFGEDEAKSMKNFVNDFKKEGLFDVSTDSKGLWDIDAKFKTTAEAANEFGMSVQSIETMLHGLEAYGYDFGDLIFSTDGLSRYEAALNGLKQIQKEIGSERLDKLFSGENGWDAEYAKISDDLSTLTEPQIIKIEFEYSLAQIQQEISRLQNLANEGGDSQTWAELNANKRAYRDKSESREGNKLAIDVEEYKQTSETIIALQDQMKNATTDAQKVAIQEQISGLYELQNAMNDTFADSGLSWDKFIQTDEYKNKISEIVSSSEEAKKAVADLLGIDVDDIKIGVDADTSKAKEKLSGVLSYSDETIVMNVDASTSEIQTVIDNLKNGQNVVFSANVEVDGEQVNQAIAAVKNQDGTISYVANIDGVQYYLDKIDNPDGTINYKLGEVPREVPSANQVVFRNPDNTKVSINPKDVSQNVNRKPKNPPSIFNPLKSITQFVKRVFTGGDSQLAGTAHFHGTAYNNGTFDNSFIKDEWKTSKGEVALTGEKAPEIVANGNRWWTVGEKGAEFSYIPPNSVVFNAEQSKQLLEKGYISSRGIAHLSGTAYRLGSGTSSTANSKNKPSNKTSKKPSTKNKPSSSSSKSSAEKAAEDLIDWIAVLLERVSKQTERAIEAIDTAIGLVNKQSATSTAISKVQNEIAKQQQAYNAYLSKANSLGLSSDYVSKVQNGSLNIENVSNEDLKKKIEDYKKYYEEAEKCKDSIDNLKKKEAELNQQRLENIEEWHDSMIDINKAMIDVSESKQELNEKLGTAIDLKVNTDELKNAIKAQQDTYNQLVQKLSDYQKEFNSQVSSGAIKKDSEAWFKGQENIQKFTSEIYKASSELIEFQDKLREIEYDTLQNLINGFERAVSKIDAQIELLEARDEVVPESLYKEQMDNNNAQIKANKELRDKKLAEQSLYDVNSERYQELAEEIQKIDEETLGLLTDNEKLKDSIFELRFNPLDEALEKYNDLSSEIKSFYDLLNEDAFFDKNGGGTADLAAGLALLQQNIAVSKQKISDLTTGLNKLQVSFDNGVISEKEFAEKSKEYRDELQSSVADVKDFSDAITDLYMKQMQKEVEATEELIDKYADARKQKEKYFDYDKKLKKQQKSVDLIKAQIAALEGINNAAAQAEKKRLEAELAQEQESLDDLKHEHKNEILDLGDEKLKEDLNTMLEDTEFVIASSAEKQQQIIDSMLSKVVGSYQSAFDKINQIIGNTGWVGSNEFNQNQSQLGTQSGAQSQKDNATQSQSNVGSSSTASGTVTDKIDNNDKFNQQVEQDVTQKPNTDNRPIAELKLSPTSVSLEEGKSTSVKATIRPNDAKNKTLSWTSSDDSIATVSNGTIRANKPGSCKITATTTDGSGISASVSVNVTKKPEPPKPKPPTPSKPITSGGNGKPEIGDAVTFTSGRYYYDSQGKRPSGNQMLGKTVYISRINTKNWATKPYHVARDKQGKHALGWLGLNQIKGYKFGTRHVNKTGEYWTGEGDGNNFTGSPEIIISKDGGVLTHLERGDKVFNHEMSENLWNLAKEGDSLLMNDKMLGLNMNGGTKIINNNRAGDVINNHFDSLLTVNGNVDKEALPKLKDILQQSYEYTSKRLFSETKRRW